MITFLLIYLIQISDIDKINSFLIEAKSLISNRAFDFIPRPKNNLALLGLNIKNALDIIMELSYKNYYAGPKEDDNCLYTGYIWEFGRDEDKYQIYIKLKIKNTSRGKLLCIMGFHKAEFPIVYPYM